MVPCAAIAIVLVVASGAYGFADLENLFPASVDTVYAIGSITKTFTAAAVLALADDGKLSLDDRNGGRRRDGRPRLRQPERQRRTRSAKTRSSDSLRSETAA